MAKYGYARVTKTTNRAEQINMLEEAGCEYIYIDNATTDISFRPNLRKLLQILGREDVLIVDNLISLAYSTSDLLGMINVITSSGATLESVYQPWISSEEKVTPMEVVTKFSEFESYIHADRVKAGMKLAQEKGVKLGRPVIHNTKMEHAIELYQEGAYTAKEIIAICGVSKSSLYRELKNRGINRD